MTISEQESMSSGGLEKEQTTLKIGLGVLKTSVIVSLSTLKSKSTISLQVYIKDASNPAIHEKADEKEIDYEYDFDMLREDVESRNRKYISEEILERFKQAGIVRYVEAWENTYKINREYITRGLMGTPDFEKTLTGIFGAFNGKAFQKAGNEWKVIDFEKLYGRVKRMPQEGIERIRATFKENKRRNVG